MAIIKQNVWGHTERPWGYEVRVDFTDDAGRIHNEVMTFKSAPSPESLVAEVSKIQARLETHLAQEVVLVALPPEPTIDDLKAKVKALEEENAELKKVK